jgi:hypothetical protein
VIAPREGESDEGPPTDSQSVLVAAQDPACDLWLGPAFDMIQASASGAAPELTS